MKKKIWREYPSELGPVTTRRNTLNGDAAADACGTSHVPTARRRVQRLWSFLCVASVAHAAPSLDPSQLPRPERRRAAVLRVPDRVLGGPHRAAAGPQSRSSGGVDVVGRVGVGAVGWVGGGPKPPHDPIVIPAVDSSQAHITHLRVRGIGIGIPIGVERVEIGDLPPCIPFDSALTLSMYVVPIDRPPTVILGSLPQWKLEERDIEDPAHGNHSKGTKDEDEEASTQEQTVDQNNRAVSKGRVGAGHSHAASRLSRIEEQVIARETAPSEDSVANNQLRARAVITGNPTLEAVHRFTLFCPVYFAFSNSLQLLRFTPNYLNYPTPTQLYQAMHIHPRKHSPPHVCVQRGSGLMGLMKEQSRERRLVKWEGMGDRISGSILEDYCARTSSTESLTRYSPITPAYSNLLGLPGCTLSHPEREEPRNPNAGPAGPP
ncbi:hypothetical protein Pelo_5073 [Pelomyxa schiedti]|nr:hypothetical protein Pelo_5073 [Pelomyxa schiedti]